MNNTNEVSLWDRLSLYENVRVIAPGLVFLKSVLDEDQQKWLADYALKAGSDASRGFWETLSTGEKVLNSRPTRGRIYDAIERFPDADKVLDLCNRLVNTARKSDGKMPEMTPTHLLLLYYADTKGMCWHSDSDKNDGDNDHPIVSISIGNSCEFGYKLMGKKEEYITLESGDVLIWGGPQRMLPHCVKEVLPNTCPTFLNSVGLSNARLNFTYRDAPNIKGKEHEWRYNVGTNYTALLPKLQTEVGPAVATQNQ